MNLHNLFESDFNNKKQLNEVDPRNFDSDEDYYAALNAPAKPRYRGQQSPGVNPDDEAYFREIFRKKREAAKKAEQDGEQGVAEGVTPASVSKVLRLIQRHHSDWFDTYGLGEVEDTVVDMAEMDKFHGMSAEDATALVGQELESLYGQQGVAEGVAETMTMDDAMKVLRHYGAGHFKTTSNELHFYKNGQPMSVDLIWGDGGERSVSLSQLNQAARQLKGQGVAEGHMSELDAEYQDYKKLSPREFFNMYRVTKQQWFEKYKSMLPQQGVAEADKKKEDELEPEVRDVALQRAISRAKADFPTAGTGIEALAKDFMRSQDQDQKSFDQIRQAERQQDQMLSQIAKIDQEQEQEIQGLEQQNSTLASRLQQLQNVNGELEKKLAAMSGRRADKKSSSVDATTMPAPLATKAEPAALKTKTKIKTKARAPATSAMKSTAAQLAAPKADPMAAMTNRITKGDSSVIDKVSGQSALPFEPSDNVLEPVIPQQQNPKFAAARRDADDAEIKRYADLTSKIAKTAITDPGQRQSAYRVHEGDNEEQEANYSDKYQDMVARVGQKAREQEKSKPVDIADLARRLAAIEASHKDK